MSYARWFLGQLAAIRTNVVVRIVAGIAQVAFGLLLVWLSRRFIDYAVWHGNVLREVLLLFGVLAVSIALRQTVFYLRDVASIRQQNSIRMRLYDVLLDRRLYATAESLHSGDIGQRLERDIEAVSAITADVMPRLAITMVQLLGAFMLLYSMDAVLAWSLLLLTPVVVACAKYLSHRLRVMTLDIRAEESRIQMLVQETVEHESTIKSLEGQPLLARRLAILHDRLSRLFVRRTRFTMLSRLLLSATFGIGYFGAFVYGGLQLRDGVITFGVMAAFLQLVSQIQNPIMSVLSMVPQVMHATASVDRLREIEMMEREPRCTDEVPLTAPIGIRLKDVSYSYPDSQSVTLSHYSHDFGCGTSTAVMGATGCGKTTLLRLVLGLVEPQGGKVELYDMAGHVVTSSAMRRHITYIPQGNTLLSGTVRDNLLLAAPDATDDDLRRALHAAVADFVIEMPDGLDTAIGERAMRLSEGQMQRIAIARGLLRSGSVMLFDEISSSLDAATEKELFTRIADYCRGKTVIMVTHRKEAALICGSILKL